jgi:hypothetical protein
MAKMSQKLAVSFVHLCLVGSRYKLDNVQSCTTEFQDPHDQISIVSFFHKEDSNYILTHQRC